MPSAMLMYKIGYKDDVMMKQINTPQPLVCFGMKFEHKTLLVRKAEGKQHETCNSNRKTIQIR